MHLLSSFIVSTCSGIESILVTSDGGGGGSSSTVDSVFSFRRFFRFLLPIAVGSPTTFDDDSFIRLIDDGLLAVVVGWKSSAVDDEVDDNDDVEDCLRLLGLVAMRSGEMGGSVAAIVGNILNGKE